MGLEPCARNHIFIGECCDMWSTTIWGFIILTLWVFIIVELGAHNSNIWYSCMLVDFRVGMEQPRLGISFYLHTLDWVAPCYSVSLLALNSCWWYKFWCYIIYDVKWCDNMMINMNVTYIEWMINWRDDEQWTWLLTWRLTWRWMNVYWMYIEMLKQVN